MPRDGKTNRAGQAAILELDELQALLYELDEPHKAIASVCYLTAGRIGEVLAIQAEHVRGGYVVFPGRNTKTGETRRVFVTAPLAAVLEQLPSQGYLFPGTGKSGHITAYAVEKAVKAAAALLDYDGVSMHSFRRSRLTHLHEQNWGLHELKRVSGHKSLQQLQQYLGVDQGAVDEKLRVADAALVLG